MRYRIASIKVKWVDKEGAEITKVPAGKKIHDVAESKYVDLPEGAIPLKVGGIGFYKRVICLIPVE